MTPRCPLPPLLDPHGDGTLAFLAQSYLHCTLPKATVEFPVMAGYYAGTATPSSNAEFSPTNSFSNCELSYTYELSERSDDECPTLYSTMFGSLFVESDSSNDELPTPRAHGVQLHVFVECPCSWHWPLPCTALLSPHPCTVPYPFFPPAGSYPVLPLLLACYLYPL